MRTKKLYGCGQSRGGTPGSPTDTQSRQAGKRAKDYYRVAVQFHGGDQSFNRWKESGMKGYNLE